MKKIFVSLAFVLSTVSLWGQVESGFGAQAELGYSLSMDKGIGKINNFEVNLSPGYHMSPYFFTGVGVGIHYYDSEHLLDSDRLIFPVYWHGTLNFAESGPFIPFLHTKLGYTSTYLTEANKKYLFSGFYCNPAVGVKYMLNDVHAITLSLGYSLQTFNRPSSYLGEISTQFNHLNFRIGWEM